MKIYMTGLIYLNGCDADEKRAYAPNGTNYDPPHHASLWLVAADVDESASHWWLASTIRQQLEGADVIEFRMPSHAVLTFPDGNGSVTCFDLDADLPRLKKKSGGREVDFEVDPDQMETIADVVIRGGEIRGCHFASIGVVQWTIGDPSGNAIMAVLDDGETGKIVLKSTGDTEVVFANIHDLPAAGRGKDPHAGVHIDLFRKLDGDTAATLVANKPSGLVRELHTSNPLLEAMRKNQHTEGDTPTCCPAGKHHHDGKP